MAQQCWKSCANGSNIVLRFGDHGIKEMLGLLAEKFDRFQTLCNNTQQHPTTCNRVCKRTQHVSSNNVGSCWPTMLRPFARGFRFRLKDFLLISTFRFWIPKALLNFQQIVGVEDCFPVICPNNRISTQLFQPRFIFR